MRVIRIVVASVIVSGVLALAAARGGEASVIWQLEAMEMSKATAGNCEQCFLFAAFDRYLAVPVRYIVQGPRKSKDGCVQFIAPGPAFGDSIVTPAYKLALETQSGQIRSCPKEVLDIEMKALEQKAKPAFVRIDGEVTIKTWSNSSLGSKFATTFIFSGGEGMLVSDVNPNFAEALWKTARRAGE